MDVLDILEARGFVQQSTGTDAIRDRLRSGQVTYYVGVDPTADSIHVGHLLPVMAMSWLQRAGHRPILVVGGGTAMVGDPSGKTEMRKMLSRADIAHNAECIRQQLSRFLVLDGERGLMLDNADWILPLNYIDFLRDIGRHFSVNRMLAVEAYKQRLERGLSFIEFNYQLLQAYDFLELHRRYGCSLQLGGDDQWANILAGTELIRRIEGNDAHGLTVPLITTASGAKMGKTAAGAVWLDPNRLSPFDFFQYWVNVDDRDVGRFLKLYTFLDLQEIAELERLEGADIRKAKARLAWEVTALVHGRDEADKAQAGARAMVSAAASEHLPTYGVPASDLAEGVALVQLLCDAQLAASRSAARRLIQQGGARLEGEKITDIDAVIGADQVGPEGVVLRAGKKKAVRILAQD